MNQSTIVKNIMVTGHKGFVGSHVYKLLSKTYNVFGFDLPDNDFTSSMSVDKFIFKNKIDTIVHIGAMAGLEHCMDFPSDAVYNNVLGTSVLLSLAKMRKCKFIHTSTWAVRGRLEHPYDITKEMSERLVNMYHDVYGLETSILRLATMYGPGMRKNGVIWAFLEKSLKDEEIVIQGDGKQFRQFLWIEDAAEAFLAALVNFRDGSTYEVQSTELTSIRDLANSVYPNSSQKIKYVEARKGDEKSFWVTPSQFGWKAKISIEVGMEKLKEYIRNG